MAHQALYRKWRPRTFSDIAGQMHITLTLKNEIASGHISHAYLFCGSHGTGKTTCAKVLAKAVNCLDTRAGDPCGECDNCVRADEGCFDIIEIDAASNNGVDNIRELRDEVIYTPAALLKKVYIIDEVHMLSTGAFNALLKTLEEPPGHVLFILATTEQNKIPATILSRCQRFDFKRLNRPDIVARLMYVVQNEGLSAQDDALELIARLADGAMRDALSILDQCISEGEVTRDNILKLLGICDAESIYMLSHAIAQQDYTACLDWTAALYETSKDMAAAVSALVSHYRDLMIYKTAGKTALLSDSDAQVRQLSDLYTLPQILYILSELQQALGLFARTPDKRLLLEMTLLKLANPSLGADTALGVRIERLEKMVEAGIPAGGTRAPEPVRSTALPSAPPALSSSPDPAGENGASPVPQTAADFWERTLQDLRNDPMLFQFLRGSSAVTQGAELVIFPADAAYIDIIQQHKQAVLKAAQPYAQDITHLRVQMHEKPAAPHQPQLDPLLALLEENSNDIELI